MKKSGFADWNTTTFTDGSASNAATNAPNSTIVVGTNMLIGGLLKVIVHSPGWVCSTLNCEGSGTAHSSFAFEERYRSDLKPSRKSSDKSCGCSHAAKCPPLSCVLK